MISEQPVRDQVAFYLARGGRVAVEFPETVVLDGRVSAGGRRVLRLGDVEIVDAERLGPVKFARLRAAVLALGGTIREL